MPERAAPDPDFPLEKLPDDSILAQVGTDLTFLAGREQLKPVHHREKELEEIAKILGRREAANPIIIGEPGVGKTAVSHLLAQKIVARQVPAWLIGWKVVETSFERMYSNVRSLASDTTEHLQNLRKVLAECREKPVILFMDEIHTITGFPYSSKVIMPALADGSLRLISATTLKEYRRYVEKNEALVRRLTPVQVGEPPPEVLTAILERVKPDMEARFRVVLPPEILRLVVHSGEKYIHNLYQPGKSIQLLEDAAINCGYQREETVRDGHVLEAVSKRSGVPARIMSGKGNLLDGLEDALNYRVLGQEEITRKIAERIFVTRMNVCLNPHRPRGVFLFAGSTGVGKTELAKALAVFLTGSESNMARFDMSVYSGAYAVNSLLGIPGSGIGDEARVPPLTQAIKDRPYTVLLLDEIEKSSPEVWKIFLSAFDEGRLADLQGTEIYFDHTTVVMTTNLGYDAVKTPRVGFLEQSRDAYEQLRQDIVGAIERRFPREFLARVDEILVFRPLTREIMRGFVRQKIELLCRITGKRLELTGEAEDFLAERGFSEKYGARFLEKTIETHLSSRIARLKTDANWDTVETIRFTVSETGEQLQCDHTTRDV